MTDSRYVYMRAPANPDNKPLYEYTLMPTHLRSFFSLEELKTAQLAEPFSFTKGVRPLKIEARTWIKAHSFGTLLFDLHTDPGQEAPLDDSDVEALMVQKLLRLMEANDAPPEQYERLGLHKLVSTFTAGIVPAQPTEEASRT